MNRIIPTYDYTLYSIPVTFILIQIPHAWSVYKLLRASNGRYSNIVPREQLTRLKNQIPEDIWGKCARAQSATLNGLEIFPLFVAAVLGGKLAGIPTEEINRMALRFLGLRTLYSLLYINHTSEKGGYLRTVVYHLSIGFPMWLLVRAGRLVNESILG